MYKNITKISFAILIVFFIGHSKSFVFPPYGHSHGIRKATQAHLFLFLPFSRFKDPQGLATTKMVSRDDPSTEHDDDELTVYGVNSGRHQLIYNVSMWGLAAYGKKGSGTGQFMFPKGVACDPQGNVYVVDAGNNRVVYLFNPGKKVKWVTAFNGAGNGDAGLKEPMQVALGAAGKIYVTDTGNRRIVVFDTSGRVVQTLSPDMPSPFQEGPTTLAVADGNFRWSYFKNEQLIFCADKNGKRLWKMDFSGKVKKVITMPEGYRAFYGAVDYYHNFYVTDKEKHCILKFDHDLNLVDIFGSFGKKDNQFVEPRGIAIWKRYGQAFAAEKSGAQYYWIGTELKKIGFWEEEGVDSFSLVTEVTEYCYMSLFYVKGSDSTTLMTKKFIRPGENVYSFKNDKIHSLQGGLFVFRVEPTYSSYTYYHWDYPIPLCKSDAAVPAGLPDGVFVIKKGARGKKMDINDLKNEITKQKGNK